MLEHRLFSRFVPAERGLDGEAIAVLRALASFALAPNAQLSPFRKVLSHTVKMRWKSASIDARKGETHMTELSLQAKLALYESPLAMLRSSQTGPYQFPVPAEFSNWRDEQRAWREGVALMDQSFHMTDLYVEGPDVIAFISGLAVNSFSGFGDNKAKQFIACAPDGHLIGDMIIFGLGDHLVNIVGRPTVANWVEFKAASCDFDVRCNRDERTLQNARPRKTFRFEIQGPDAWALLEKLNGGPIDQPRFFQMGRINVAHRSFRSLRHGMGGAPGLEFWGPFEHYDEAKATILDVGNEFGLRQVGARAYSSAAVDFRVVTLPSARDLFGRGNARLSRVVARQQFRWSRGARW